MLGVVCVIAGAMAFRGYRLADHFVMGAALCLVVFTLALIGWECAFPATLGLTKSGLEYRSRFSKRTWEWRYIDDFQLTEPILLQRLVAFNSRFDPDLERPRLRRWGVNANIALPGAWNVDSSTLLQLLTKAKTDWG
jgi:hypothetical protein